jgi:hypothetical protein
MSDVPLAQKYSAETFDQALSNLVERWKQEGGEDPIKYDEAAVGMDETTVSVALKFLGEIGLLEVPKAGSYIVPDDVLDYRTKLGEVERSAKREVAARLEEYPLYKETKFMLGLNDFTLDELAEDVSGNAAVAAEKDELPDVKRTLMVLAGLGFLEIDEEGVVSIPADLEADSESESIEDGVDAGGDGGGAEGEEGEAQRQPADSGDGAATEPPLPDGVSAGHVATPGLAVDMDISMNVTEMGPDEIREKLEAIKGALEKA